MTATTGNDPDLILRAYNVDDADEGLRPGMFDELIEEAWRELGNDVAFNFPYLAVELLHAAEELLTGRGDNDDHAGQDLDTTAFLRCWRETVAEAACRRMVFNDDERIAREVEHLVPWVAAARSRGLISPVPAPEPRDDRQDLREAVDRAKEAGHGLRPVTTILDVMFASGRTVGQIHAAAKGRSVSELAASHAESGLDWGAFIDRENAQDGTT